MLNLRALSILSIAGYSSVNAWTLSQSSAGSSFFDNWTYNSGGDPTNGQVTYVTGAQATADSLTYVDGSGHAFMTVDTTSTLAAGAPRNSVRIESTYVLGIGSLIIMDAEHVPYGCSVWPAFWAVGPNWPSSGEIDIFEGVNQNTQNSMTLHTEPGCSHGAGSETGTAGQATCDTSVNGNTGCGVTDPSTASYGSGFAAAGGGVWATEWTTDGVNIWFFSRGNVPADISSPDPTTWGTPTGSWPASACNPSTFFANLQLVFDITLCGDWAGQAAVWSASGCPQAACTDAVSDPSNYANAYFSVNYVNVYSQ